MPTSSVLAAFAVACLVLLLIPGPSVLFTVGRALSVGRRAAILSVLGNGLGTMTLAGLVAVGLGPVVAASDRAFTVMKVAGAAYLMFLGIRAIRHRRSVSTVRLGADGAGSWRAALRAGYLVGVSNPKTLVFLSALLPQFVRPGAGPVWVQVLVLAAVLVVIGWGTDSAYALAAGQARAWLGRSSKRMERVTAAGGVMMAGLGVGLLLTGRPAD